MDREVLEWVVTELKESQDDEKRYYDEMIAKPQKEYQKLQDCIDAVYMDKLDGKVPQEFFDRKNSDWRGAGGNSPEDRKASNC